MKISNLIEHLEKVKEIEGDIPCVINVSHDYWGNIQYPIDEYLMLVADAQPEGPKSGKSERCVIFSHY